MVNLASKVAIVGVVVFAAFYQFFFKSIIFDTLGYGRKVLSIKDFSHIKCEKVDELGLEACEDMWLHEPTGYLYMACSDSQSRTQWTPALDRLNASGRGLTDRIAILDTRGPGRLASRIQWISVENFPGIKGDKTLNLHGLDVRVDKNTDTLRILLVNHRPPIDPITGEFLDAAVVGANSTVELFQTKAGSDTMRHVRTYVHGLIETPNNVAWINDDSFVFTNDHSGKVGFRRKLDHIIGGGSIGFCSRNNCNIAFSTGFKMPNGLIKGRDGLIYVPDAVTGTIDIFSLGQDHKLTKIDRIDVGMPPIDNLSVDKNGDIFAASFSRLYQFLDHADHPFDIHPAASVFRIRRAGKGYRGSGRKGNLAGHDTEYEVELVMEDDGVVLPSATVAVHDVETGRFFLGGVMSPFIAICETR